MKIQKFADKKKELIAIILISVIVTAVSVYVIYLVHGLTTKVYRVFGQSTDQTGGFTHFDFAKFEELELRPRRATSTPALEPSSTTPIIPATTTSSTSLEQSTSTSLGGATTTPASSS